jgi:potassium-transporting ATPase KdpC subunit
MRIAIAIKMALVMTLLTGIIYPLLVFGLAHLFFPTQAEGSLVIHDNHVIGSSLIGQNFTADRYFHPRPSAAGNKGYDATSSGGSNSGPTNKAFIDTLKTRVKALRETNPALNHGSVPVDLVTASGSGLDPEITPAAASIQIARIAKARSMSEGAVRALVAEHTRSRWAGVLGEPGVNVLELNLALDAAGNAHDYRGAKTASTQ